MAISFSISSSKCSSLIPPVDKSFFNFAFAALMASLAPLGRLHQLGAVVEPIQVDAFDLIKARRSITGSPTSSPASLLKMVDFCVRHNIRPQVEHLPINRVNEALERLQKGDVRYRFVLDLIGN